MNQNRNDHFSFGELMIVVGIIVILAAIAIPNFIETYSPLRGEISATQNDMRSIAMAIESYRDRNGSVPPVNAIDEIDLHYLTTPVAYMATLPADALRKKAGMADTCYRVYADPTTSTARTKWMMSSIGPDLLANTSGYRSMQDVLANEALPSPAIGIDRDGKNIGASGYGGMRYDPTNGTKSYGDIYRFEGDAATAE